MSYLFAAYTVTWVLLFAYIYSLGGKQRKLDEELTTLRKLIEQKK
jgi:CcmD family protein